MTNTNGTAGTGRWRPEIEPLLTPIEVARIFRVDPKTVTRWANTGRLSSLRTLGNHRRYRAAEVQALLEAGRQSATARSAAALAHTVGVEALTGELRATDSAIPANATYALVERGSGGALIKVGATDVDALQGGYSLKRAAAAYAKTVGATYIKAGA